MTPDRHSASKGMGITSWDDLQGRPVAARRLIRKFRVIVYAVPVGEPALKPARKILALAAGLGSHLAQAPDLAPAGAGDNQLEGLAAADVDELQRPLLNCCQNSSERGSSPSSSYSVKGKGTT